MAKLALFLGLSALILLVGLAQAGHDHFFQYANVPGWQQYEFGYNRGNHNHFTSRFEKAHGWTFKTKVRWGDKNGWGESYWDYNHGDKGWGKGHEQKGHHKGWGHHGHGHHGSYSENVPNVASPRISNSFENQQQQSQQVPVVEEPIQQQQEYQHQPPPPQRQQPHPQQYNHRRRPMTREEYVRRMNYNQQRYL